MTSSQRGFLVFQASEVFINGLEPNIMDCFRLPSSFFEICLKCRLATLFLIGIAHSKWPCLFVNCFRMPTSICVRLLKSLNIATSAVGLRQAAGRVLSCIQISHGQAEERLHFFNGDIQSVVSCYFCCRLLGWKSITAWKMAILSHCYSFFASNRYNHACKVLAP